MDIGKTMYQDTYSREAESKFASNDKGRWGRIKKLIGKAESRFQGYDDFNTGTRSISREARRHHISKGRLGSRHGRGDTKWLTNLTIKEIQRRQKLNNKERIFAVGKYQWIPKTFKEVVKAARLTGNEKFSPELQEKMFDSYYGETGKRPALKKLYKGEPTTIHEAGKDLSKEWAGLPVLSGSKRGKSYYPPPNKATVSPEQLEKVLDPSEKKARIKYDSWKQYYDKVPNK